MTVSLAAVFIPVLFMGGIVGRLLHEFAVTIVIAILVSGFVSVSLTPMLCSRLIRPVDDERDSHRGMFYRWAPRWFAMQGGYARSLRWSLAHRRLISDIRRQPGSYRRAVPRHAGGLPPQ